MSHDRDDFFHDEMAGGTNVITLDTEVLYTIVQRLARIKPTANRCIESMTGVKVKRDIVAFQFILLEAREMELINTMDNPLAI